VKYFSQYYCFKMITNMNNSQSKIFNIWARLKKILVGGYEELLSPYYQGVSGQLAFFLFLSILPLFTLFSKMLAVFSLSLDSVKSWANVNLTASGLSMFESILGEGRTTPIGTIGSIVLALTTIWAASKAQYSFTGITDYINNDGERTGKNYLQRRARSYVFILLYLIVLVLALTFLVYLPYLFELVVGDKALLSGLILSRLRWVIVFALYFFSISFIYYLSPSKIGEYKDVIPGSIFSSIGFIVVNFFYGLFTQKVSINNVIYGSLSNIVILLVWFWFMSWVMILGIVLNKEWKATRVE